MSKKRYTPRLEEFASRDIIDDLPIGIYDELNEIVEKIYNAGVYRGFCAGLANLSSYRNAMTDDKNIPIGLPIGVDKLPPFEDWRI